MNQLQRLKINIIGLYINALLLIYTQKGHFQYKN